MSVQSPRPTGLRLLLHFLAPSGIGLLLYFLVAGSIIGAHLLYISLSGQAYPASFNETLLLGYANFIIGPLAAITNNSSVSNAATVVAWGIVGLVVYEGVAFIVRAIADLKGADNDVGHPHLGMVVAHPMEGRLLARLGWQLLIGVLIVASSVLAVPIVRHCLRNDLHVMKSSTPLPIASTLVITLLIWMLLFHAYVLLLRLYVLRTRILGEILY